MRWSRKSKPTSKSYLTMAFERYQEQYNKLSPDEKVDYIINFPMGDLINAVSGK